jgi:hypothetical protein
MRFRSTIGKTLLCPYIFGEPPLVPLGSARPYVAPSRARLVDMPAFVRIPKT